MKPSATSENRSQKTHGFGFRLFTAFLIVLVVLGIGVWWKRSIMMQWVLQRFLDRTSLVSPRISGLQFGFDQAMLSEMEFGIDTGVGRLSAKLAEVGVGYDFRIPKVKTIVVAHAQLKLGYQAAGVAGAKGGGAPFGTLAYPLERLTIENLDFEFDTPWGISRFIGRAEISRDTANLLEAKFEDAKKSFRMEFGPGFRTAKVVAEKTPGNKVFELTADHLDQADRQARLRAGIGALGEWLSTSVLMPETLRAKIAPSVATWIKPNVASVQLDFSTGTADKFHILQGRALLTRDGQYLAGSDLSLTKLGAVDLNAHLDMAVVDLLELVQPWLPEMARAWRFTAGKVQGTSQLRWQDQRLVSGVAHLNAFDVALVAGTVHAVHASINVDMADLSRASLALSGDIPELGFGKEMLARNLYVKAAFQDNQLKLERGVGSMFGGQLEILPTTIDLKQRPILLTLRIRDVDLSQLLATLHYKDLSVSGIVSGELPLRVTGKTVELQDGLLIGARPGVLRYQGPVADKENLAFRALRNLEYHSLQAKVNYQPNGGYHLGLRLEGSNPEVLSGHPIAFNLNLSGQLPELLKKGMMAGDFERAILDAASTASATTNKSTKPLLKPPVGTHQPKPPLADRRSQ